jgi:hypothetical protein
MNTIPAPGGLNLENRSPPAETFELVEVNRGTRGVSFTS